MINMIDALNSVQKELKTLFPMRQCPLNPTYKMIWECVSDIQRFSYAKIIDGEVRALSMFVTVGKFEGIPLFQFGYVVKEKYRNKGLGLECANAGLEELKNGLFKTILKKFYFEAVIDMNNHNSIKIAKKVFSSTGKRIIDDYNQLPSLHFIKLEKKQ